MMEVITAAKKQGDTLGGLYEVMVVGLPVGLGSYTQWDLKLDGLLAQAVMSIQSHKGVEIGRGFALAHTKGSDAHDEITDPEDVEAGQRQCGRVGRALPVFPP